MIECQSEEVTVRAERVMNMPGAAGKKTAAAAQPAAKRPDTAKALGELYYIECIFQIPPHLD